MKICLVLLSVLIVHVQTAPWHDEPEAEIVEANGNNEYRELREEEYRELMDEEKRELQDEENRELQEEKEEESKELQDKETREFMDEEVKREFMEDLEVEKRIFPNCNTLCLKLGKKGGWCSKYGLLGHCLKEKYCVCTWN